jgi:hypothetical protein
VSRVYVVEANRSPELESHNAYLARRIKEGTHETNKQLKQDAKRLKKIAKHFDRELVFPPDADPTDCQNIVVGMLLRAAQGCDRAAVLLRNATLAHDEPALDQLLAAAERFRDQLSASRHAA